MNLISLQKTCWSLLCMLLTSGYAVAQTPGLIVRPTPPAASPAILDPNRDGFTSLTTAGFGTNDVGAANSEIPYRVIPPFKLEPTADLMRGPNDRFSDLVRISNDESGMYVFSDGTNLMFRLRVGDIVAGSKGYSILIDADGRMGSTGPAADPNYQAATTGINGNPGFELEVVLETNFQVSVYDVDGRSDAGASIANFPLNTHSQISIAASSVSGTPDFLYDFYVPLAALRYGSPATQVTAGTGLRVSATTVMAPKAAIGGPKSDIFGYDGKDYMKAWEDIINYQQPFTPSNITPSGTGVRPLCSAPPVITSGNIGTGTVTIAGTWTQADPSKPAATATITLYKGAGTVVATRTVVSGSSWSISNTAVNGDVFYARAAVAGESDCFQSNSVAAIGCTAANTSSLASLTLFCASIRGFDGTAPVGSIVRIYQVSATGFTLFADQSTTTYRITRPGGTRWYYDGPFTNSADPCKGGQDDVPVGNFAISIQEPGKCESGFLFVNNDNKTCTPTATPLVSQPVLYGGTSVVSGTATAGAAVFLFVNKVQVGRTTATGGNYSFTTPTLAVGDVVEVYALSGTLCMSAATVRNVVCLVPAPAIATAGSGSLAAGTTILGTANVPAGSDVRLLAGATVVATVKVQSDGSWSSGVAALAGTTYTATLTTGCGSSGASAPVTALPATTACATIIGSYAEGNSAVSGTISPAFTGTVRLYLDGVQLGSSLAVTGATTWTIPFPSSELYADGQLTVTTQASGSAEREICSSAATVACTPPPAPVVSPVNALLLRSNGVVSFTIANSEAGTLYTLEEATAAAADRSISVFGNGGSLPVNSFPFLTPGVSNLRITAYKLGGGPTCNRVSTAVSITVTDTDADNILDVVDIDDDNDGLLDINEVPGGADPLGDADGDGIANFRDGSPGISGLPTTDTNGDGILDHFDTDRDGIINNYDLDTDNDGIPDIVETGGTDADNDGRMDGATDNDGDGLRNAADATPTGGAAGSQGLQVADFDGDGIPNFRDLDADGDGIVDSRESGLNLDANNNGVLNDDPGYTGGADGWSDAADALAGPLPLRNTDSHGRSDYLDIDSDNDGIVDNIEAATTTGYTAPLASGSTDADGDGINDRYDNTAVQWGGNSNNGVVPANTDGDTLPDYLDTDSDNDGFPDAIEGHDTNGDNQPNANSATKLGTGGTVDTDNDGLLDGYDNNTSAVNPTNSTTPASYPNVDGGTTERDWREVADSDRDGRSNNADVDDDNDGIPDNAEYGGIDAYGDADGDGTINYLDRTPGTGLPAFADTNGDGINDAYDADRDGILNSLDLDSDGDGIPDLVEAGGVDTNGDGVVDVTTDTDADGLMNPYDGSTGGVNISNLNSDGSGPVNYLDLDSDNDGITDVAEAGGVDANGDGRLDNYNDTDGDGLDDTVDGDVGNDGTAENSSLALMATGADTNNNGQPDTYLGGLSNTDSRGLPNPYDLDSDDDGLADVWEARGTFADQDTNNDGRLDTAPDADNDGLLDSRDGDVGNDGTAENTANTLLPTGADANNDGRADSYARANADGDLRPNPYDVDADNDGVPDLMESGGIDTNGDGRIDVNSDADNNGWQNRYDVTVSGGLNLKNLDYNGGAPGGSIFDLDTDGIFNPYDLDSDNDGIADVAEAGGVDTNGDGRLDNFNDTDADGFDDSLDPDIGNDGTMEGPSRPLFFTGADTDNDGIPNSFPVVRANPDFDILPNGYDLDSDDDGLPDLLEAGGLDANNDGRIDLITTFAAADPDGDGLVNTYDGDGNNDGVADNSNTLLPTGPDADDNGKADTYLKANADADAYANPYDLDSDDDGIPDLIEQGGVDTGGDGMADSRMIIDGNLNGWQAAYEPASGGIALRNIDVNGAAGGQLFDFDNDGIANFLDLDSDGDGIPDLVEQGGNDADNDGRLNTTNDVDQDGFKDIHDRINNTTGAVLGTPFITTGALNNTTRIPASYSGSSNWDGNALPNFLDLDSDGDGILDVREALFAESTTESQAAGVPGADGWSNDVDGRTTLGLPDTDSDGRPDYLDIDADNDGITDNVEAQPTPGYALPDNADIDWDGIDDRYDNNTAAFAGNGTRDIVPVNTDATDLPDYRDTDSDNDTDPDLIEGNDLNNNKKADDIVLPIAATDSDGDGLLDFFDLLAGPRVTIAGFLSGTGSRSPAQQTLPANANRDWRDQLFNFTYFTLLPVQFVAVQLEVAGKGTRLSWLVTNEADVAYYQVERSTNGQQFDAIGRVLFQPAGVGSQNSYTWLDPAAPSGTLYYRIRQVDTDGDVQYSTVVSRYNSIGTPVVQVFPNPLSSASKVQVVVQANQRGVFRLFAADGRLARQLEVQLVKGSNTIQLFSYGLLARGTYLLQVKLEEGYTEMIRVLQAE